MLLIKLKFMCVAYKSMLDRARCFSSQLKLFLFRIGSLFTCRHEVNIQTVFVAFVTIQITQNLYNSKLSN